MRAKLFNVACNKPHREFFFHVDLLLHKHTLHTLSIATIKPMAPAVYKLVPEIDLERKKNLSTFFPDQSQDYTGVIGPNV